MILALVLGAIIYGIIVFTRESQVFEYVEIVMDLNGGIENACKSLNNLVDQGITFFTILKKNFLFLSKLGTQFWSVSEWVMFQNSFIRFTKP